jgi:nicotinamide mononucleotide transporter
VDDPLHWLFTATLHIGQYDILWREIVGNGFGLAGAILGMRRSVWTWPIGIVGNVLLFTVFLGVAFGNPQDQTLWGQAARQVFFVVVSSYGWWRWRSNRRSGSDAPAVSPRWATARERAAYLAAGVLGVLLCWAAFRAVGTQFPAPWWYFLADAWIFVGSILATYAMARGWVDFWVCWLAVDLVGVPELLYFKFYPSAVLYAVYGGFVVWGLVVWLRVARTEGGVGGLREPEVTVVA